MKNFLNTFIEATFYVLAFISITIGINGASGGDGKFSGIVILAAGIVIIPIFYKFLYKNFSKKFTAGGSFALYVALHVFAFALISAEMVITKTSKSDLFKANRERLITSLENIDEANDSGSVLEESKTYLNIADIPFKKAYSRAFNKYETEKQEKQREIDGQNAIRAAAIEAEQIKAAKEARLNDPKKKEYLAIIDSYLYEIKIFNPLDIKDAASFDNALFRIRSYSKIFHEKDHYEFTDEENKILSDYEMKLIALQKKVFPQIRKTYGSVVQQKGWEHNIEGRTFGDGFRILELSSFYFADNGNIKQVMETFLPIVQELRFKEIRFKWSKGADEYQVYKIDPLSDSMIQ